MGVLQVQAVGEGDTVAVGGAPPLPTGLVREDVDQRLHLVLSLVEGVLVQEMAASSPGLGPPPGGRVVSQLSPLHFEDQEAVHGMGDEEVGFALDGRPARRLGSEHPVDAVVDDIIVGELLQESFV